MDLFIHVKNTFILLFDSRIINILDDEDFCRVCLDKKESPDQSDYINASIIRSIPPV
jgi:hypothetical protein